MVTATVSYGKQIEVWYDPEQGDWCHRGEKTPVSKFDLLQVGFRSETKALKQIRANLDDAAKEEDDPSKAEVARMLSIAITAIEGATLWIAHAGLTLRDSCVTEE